VVVEAVVDPPATGEGRNEQGRHAEAAERVERIVVGCALRRHVLEETAPLVERDHEQRARPGRARGHRRIDLRQEPFAGADVGRRVVVAAQPEHGQGVGGVDVGNSGQFPRAAVAAEVRPRAGDPRVPRSPEREEGEVPSVVTAGDAAFTQGVPDRPQAARHRQVVRPVGAAGVHVHPVRHRRAEDRGEVAIAHRPGGRGPAEERQIGLRVVAEAVVVVVARPEPAVTASVVVRNSAAGVAVIRVREAATLEIRRQRVSRMCGSALVEVGQPGLPAVGARKPAEEVVEGAVLHHHDDDVIESRPARIGQPT
jgi:hypothetical protein